MKLDLLAKEYLTASCQSNMHCVVATSLNRLFVVNLNTFATEKVVQMQTSISILKCTDLLPDCILIGSNLASHQSSFQLMIPDGSLISSIDIHDGKITDFDFYQSHGKTFIVSTCSDGKIRLFEIDFDNRKINLSRFVSVDDEIWPTKVIVQKDNTIVCGLENGSFFVWEPISNQSRIFAGYTSFRKITAMAQFHNLILSADNFGVLETKNENQ